MASPKISRSCTANRESFHPNKPESYDFTGFLIADIGIDGGAKLFEIRISKSQINSGELYVPTRVREVLPKGYEKTTVKIILDDEIEPRLLMYHPYNHVLSGLRDWQKQHEARLGDLAIIEPLDVTSNPPLYKLTFKRGPQEGDTPALK